MTHRTTWVERVILLFYNVPYIAQSLIARFRDMENFAFGLRRQAQNGNVVMKSWASLSFRLMVHASD